MILSVTFKRFLIQFLKIVDTVKTIVDGVGQAKEIIDAWETGSAIFGWNRFVYKGLN